PETSPLSLHDALPILKRNEAAITAAPPSTPPAALRTRYTRERRSPLPRSQPSNSAAVAWPIRLRRRFLLAAGSAAFSIVRCLSSDRKSTRLNSSHLGI